MTAADLDEYEVEREGYAYSAYLSWLATNGSAAEVVCGLLVNFAAWSGNCSQVSAGLRAQYGFTRDDTVFLDRFEAMPSFENKALVIIQDDLDRGITDVRIMRAARLIQGYEGMFWDTMARIASEQPRP